MYIGICEMYRCKTFNIDSMLTFLDTPDPGKVQNTPLEWNISPDECRTSRSNTVCSVEFEPERTVSDERKNCTHEKSYSIGYNSHYIY